MQTHFKNKRGRMKLDIPEVKAKREIYGKRKGSSAGKGLTDFKKVCVMWGVKNFLPAMGEDEDEETMAAHEKRLQHQSQLSTAGFPKGVLNMGRKRGGGGGSSKLNGRGASVKTWGEHRGSLKCCRKIPAKEFI